MTKNHTPTPPIENIEQYFPCLLEINKYAGRDPERQNTLIMKGEMTRANRAFLSIMTMLDDEKISEQTRGSYNKQFTQFLTENPLICRYFLMDGQTLPEVLEQIRIFSSGLNNGKVFPKIKNQGSGGQEDSRDSKNDEIAEWMPYNLPSPIVATSVLRALYEECADKAKHYLKLLSARASIEDGMSKLEDGMSKLYEEYEIYYNYYYDQYKTLGQSLKVNIYESEPLPKTKAKLDYKRGQIDQKLSNDYIVSVVREGNIDQFIQIIDIIKDMPEYGFHPSETKQNGDAAPKTVVDRDVNKINIPSLEAEFSDLFRFHNLLNIRDSENQSLMAIAAQNGSDSSLQIMEAIYRHSVGRIPKCNTIEEQHTLATKLKDYLAEIKPVARSEVMIKELCDHAQLTLAQIVDLQQAQRNYPGSSARNAEAEPARGNQKSEPQH